MFYRFAKWQEKHRNAKQTRLVTPVKNMPKHCVFGAKTRQKREKTQGFRVFFERFGVLPPPPFALQGEAHSSHAFLAHASAKKVE